MLGLTLTASGAALEDRAAAALDRRLRPHAPQPLGVALSGGGDSLALLLLARAWAQANGRALIAFTVDHQLQPLGGAWATACALRCADLGVTHRTLVWTGAKPASGLAAAARQARHRLIADAARLAGARAVLFGHTADDVAEAALMRASGSTTPSPRAWTPSPVWPQGRGLFLLRPLLQIGRTELRAWLDRQGAGWIDDPANEDLRSARARARRRLAGVAPPAPPDRDDDALAALARACEGDAFGTLALPRAALRAAPGAARAFVAAASLCAAGGARPPTGPAVARLTDKLLGQSPLVATLAGARIEAREATIRWMREPGEAARGGLADLPLDAGETSVWDGRFEATAERPLTVTPLRGGLARLTAAQRASLASCPAAGRGALPAPAPGLAVRPLAHDRLLAACGAVAREP